MTRRALCALTIITLAAGLCVTGCKSGKTRHNFSHIEYNLLEEPITKPARDLSQYSSFCLISNGRNSDPLLKSQLLSLARGMMQALGYRYVDDMEKADIVLCIVFSNEYSETYVPPKTVTIPKYVEPETETTTSYWSGEVGGVDTGGMVQTHTTKPGYWTTQTYTRPGYTVGSYYPVVGIGLHDSWGYLRPGASSDTVIDYVVWSGGASASSKLWDLRMTGQMLMLELVKSMPRCAKAQPPNAWLGIDGTMLTPDGKNLFPTILRVAEGSPAAKAGLRQWDIIWEIDGHSTANMTYDQVGELLSGRAGDPKTLTIARLDEKIPCRLELAPYRRQ